MCVIEVAMRRPPPCSRCAYAGVVTEKFGQMHNPHQLGKVTDFDHETGMFTHTCPRCQGRSAHIEYMFIFWPSGAASFGRWPGRTAE